MLALTKIASVFFTVMFTCAFWPSLQINIYSVHIYHF